MRGSHGGGGGGGGRAGEVEEASERGVGAEGAIRLAVEGVISRLVDDVQLWHLMEE